MMGKIKISVVIASYNGAEYFKEQLESIRMQTLPPDELIICDDRSTDKTVDVAREFIKEHKLDNSWQIIVNEKNLGYAENFDNVAKKAKGDLIFFSDQDDEWDLHKLEIMTGIMRKHHECKVLCTDYEPYYMSEDVPQAPKSIRDRMPDNGMLENVKLSKKSVYIGALGCCMCVRRQFYQEISEYYFSGWAQDDRLWKMAQCANGCLILHKNLVKHRIHGHNTATYGKYHTVERRVKLFWQMLKANKQMLKYLSVSGGGKKEIKIVNKHIVMMKKRIKLIRDKEILNIFPLLIYLPYYEKVKSYLVELYLAMKRDRNEGK